MHRFTPVARRVEPAAESLHSEEDLEDAYRRFPPRYALAEAHIYGRRIAEISNEAVGLPTLPRFSPRLASTT